MRPTVAECSSVSLDMALLVDTMVGDQVQLPQGPSLKLVRRADDCAVFQVLTHISLHVFGLTNKLYNCE